MQKDYTDRECELREAYNHLKTTQDELSWEKQKSVALNERIHTLSSTLRSMVDGVTNSNATDSRNFSGNVPPTRGTFANAFAFRVPGNQKVTIG